LVILGVELIFSMTNVFGSIAAIALSLPPWQAKPLSHPFLLACSIFLASQEKPYFNVGAIFISRFKNRSYKNGVKTGNKTPERKSSACEPHIIRLTEVVF